MTSVQSMSRAESRPAPPPASTAVEFRYTQTGTFAALLRELGASLVITTYQANKVLVARATGAGLSMLVRTFDRPMGLATFPPRPSGARRAGHSRPHLSIR